MWRRFLSSQPHCIATESRRLSPALSSLGFSAHPPTTPSHRCEQNLLTNLHHSKLFPSFVRRALGKYLTTHIETFCSGPPPSQLIFYTGTSQCFGPERPASIRTKSSSHSFTLFAPNSTFARHCIIFSLSDQTLRIDTHRTVAKDKHASIMF